MENERYEAWSLRLHKNGVARRTPLNGTIEVTRRCNLSCAHCYTNLPVGARKAKERELSTKEHSRLIDEMAESGCLWLLFTGGEIFVREDFLDIYSHAKERGLIVTLFTNGTLITPEIADYLAEWRPFSIEVTLYGRTRETYEGVTGVRGSYDRCLGGIQLLIERSLPLALKSLALRSNAHELRDMKRFVEDDLGLEFRFDAMLNPRIDGSRRPLALRLSPEAVVRLDLEDGTRGREWQRFCAHFTGPGPRDRESLYQCGGALHSFAVTPEGTLVPCVLSRRSGYDLRDGSFREGWHRFLGPLREEKARRQTRCSACRIKAMCGMCPANGELEQGDPEEPVEFLCRVAHLRAYALGIPVPDHGECDYCRGGGKYEELAHTARLLRKQTG
jgi:radical SAM protein with 4Fe4S-binding SPASM domain